MNTLRIFIADHQNTQVCAWVLFDAMHNVLRSGQDTLNSLPIAEQTEVIVPANWVGLTPTALPAGNRKRVLDALPYLIEDQLIANPEETHVVIAETLEGNNAILASIDKQTLAALLDTLKNKGIQATRVLPATLATRYQRDSWVMVYDDDYFFIRTGSASGLALERDTEDTAPPLALQLAVRQAKSAQKLPEEILVYGNPAINLNDWSTALGMHFTASTSDWKISPLKTNLNLLQGRFEPASQAWAVMSQIKPAIFLLIGIIVLSLIGSTIDWARQSMERNKLDNEMKALFISTFPDTTSVVDAPLQMQRKLADMQHASGETDTNDFLPILASVTARTGSLSNIKAMDYENDQLSLTLLANREDEARALAQKISIPGRIVVIENLKSVASGVEFQLVFKADDE